MHGVPPPEPAMAPVSADAMPYPSVELARIIDIITEVNFMVLCYRYRQIKLGLVLVFVLVL